MKQRSTILLSALLAALGLGCSNESNDPLLSNLLGKGLFASAAKAPGDCLTPADIEGMAEQVSQRINLERTAAGLSPLSRSEALDGVASSHACRMISQGFFDHDDPETGSPAERALLADFHFIAVGENIAGGQMSVQEVMDAWMGSPDHRDNLLSPLWREIGVSIRTGGAYGVYWVTEFALPVVGTDWFLPNVDTTKFSDPSSENAEAAPASDATQSTADEAVTF